MEWLTYLIWPLMFIIIILIIIKKAVVFSRWHHTFNEIQIPPQDFLASVEGDLERKGIPKVEMERTLRRQQFLFGAHREYVRIQRGKHVFEICTAHVGIGCYVSWWFFERQSLLRRFFSSLPVIRWFLSKKTLHEIDEEDAFRDMVHQSVLDSVDAMTGQKGSTLSEAERSVISLRYLTSPQL